MYLSKKLISAGCVTWTFSLKMLLWLKDHRMGDRNVNTLQCAGVSCIFAYFLSWSQIKLKSLFFFLILRKDFKWIFFFFEGGYRRDHGLRSRVHKSPKIRVISWSVTKASDSTKTSDTHKPGLPPWTWLLSLSLIHFTHAILLRK